jgi:NADPH:quinone reductase-like Zn-dependent oxidoreductase
MKYRLRKRIRWGRWILAGLVLAIAGLAFAISYRAPCPSPSMVDSPDPMQAIRYQCYGPTNVLRLELAARPGLEDDMLLVKVHAASVNPLDWHFMRGEPYVMRAQLGMGAPKDPRLGVDFSGTVAAVGRLVTRFKPGDEVFGGAQGSFAQFLAVRESGAVTRKPPNVSHAEAAAVPIAAVTALQALRDQGHLEAGQRVLINGASGGVGTYAVQIAKAMGAEVTGVCSTRNVDLVASLGADRVLDYKNVDFTTGETRYDLVIDTVGNRSLREVSRVLEPAGIHVIVGAPSRDPWIGGLSKLIAAKAYAPFADHQLKLFLADLNAKDLGELAALMESGRVKSVIDRTYPLAEVPAAVAYVEEGHARGKVIVTVD